MTNYFPKPNDNMWEIEKLSLKIVIAQVAIVQNTMIASSIVGVLYLKYRVGQKLGGSDTQKCLCITAP